MDKTRPYRVTTANGRTHLLVMNATEGLPAAFALMGTNAGKKVAIRITGGCKGMSAEEKEAMLAFFATAFDGYRGVVFSGGTRQVDGNGETDPMVTDVPGVIAGKNKECVALGTLPRTSMFSLQNDSRLVLDDYGTAPNPEYHGILIVQNGADGKSEWDGDLDVYFSLMDNWKTYAKFEQLGMVSWNGGAITEKEIMKAFGKGWPVFLIAGSGRATDEIIQKLATDSAFVGKLPRNAKYVVLGKENPYNLRDNLVKYGFID